jgi:uncharacterized membrane protein
MSTETDRLIEDYLRTLERELDGLPWARRREVLDEISEHISAARAELENESESAIRTMLDRLGDPADIAAEAGGRVAGAEPSAIAVRSSAGWQEIAALVLLPLGGLVIPVLGWVIGLILLWSSNAWTTREKLLGTLVVPGGLVVPVALFFMAGASVRSCASLGDGSVTCTGGESHLMQGLLYGGLIALLLAPLLVVIFLARRMNRRLPVNNSAPATG